MKLLKQENYTFIFLLSLSKITCLPLSKGAIERSQFSVSIIFAKYLEQDTILIHSLHLASLEIYYRLVVYTALSASP